jgi:hypothetical protein
MGSSATVGSQRKALQGQRQTCQRIKAQCLGVEAPHYADYSLTDYRQPRNAVQHAEIGGRIQLQRVDLGAAKPFFNERDKKKRQTIFDPMRTASPQWLAAAIDSSTNSVSTMIHQMKELAEQGWKISFTDLDEQLGRCGAPARPYRLVRL